jgi:hypothetical protein
MRARLLVLAALALGAGQQPARDGPAPAERPTGTAAIAGRITILDTDPAAPVRRAKVTLSSPDLPSAEVTDTDTDGRYRFDGLPAGDYRITAEKPGFVTLEYGAARPFERPVPLRLATGTTRDASIALPRGAAIEGRLVAADGEPILNAIVSAVRFTVVPQGRRPVTVREARTDDLGRYRIHSLPPGDYYVSAAADPVQAIAEGTLPGVRPQGSARTYFPGTVQPHEARRIRLGIAEEAARTDFTLTAVPVITVLVTATDSSGKPAGVRGARLQPVGGPPGDVRGTVPEPGAVQFPRVPPGDYWLTMTTSAEGATQEFAAQRVLVSGDSLPDLQVRTARGASLDVRVEPADVAATARLRLRAIETDFELPFGPTPPPPPAIGPGGTLALHGVFGPRLFRVDGLPAGWALDRVWLDEADITDTPFDFRETPVPRRLRLVLTDRTTTIEAVVTGASGTPAAGARVVAFSADERRWGPTSRFVVAALSDGSGTARLAGLLPGDYIVVAADYLEDDAWLDPDVLRSLRPAGTAVTIDGSGERSRRVTLEVRR